MRFSNCILGSSNEKHSWQALTVSTLFVLNSFIKNPLITKSSDKQKHTYAHTPSRKLRIIQLLAERSGDQYNIDINQYYCKCSSNIEFSSAPAMRPQLHQRYQRTLRLKYSYVDRKNGYFASLQRIHKKTEVKAYF